MTAISNGTSLTFHPTYRQATFVVTEKDASLVHRILAESKKFLIHADLRPNNLTAITVERNCSDETPLTQIFRDIFAKQSDSASKKIIEDLDALETPAPPGGPSFNLITAALPLK
jgi:hypothetical protein